MEFKPWEKNSDLNGVTLTFLAPFDSRAAADTEMIPVGTQQKNLPSFWMKDIGKGVSDN